MIIQDAINLGWINVVEVTPPALIHMRLLWAVSKFFDKICGCLYAVCVFNVTKKQGKMAEDSSQKEIQLTRTVRAAG